jgi:hypothetical protein
MLRLWILPVLGLIATLGIACGDEGEDLPSPAPTVAPTSGTFLTSTPAASSQTKGPTPTASASETLWRWVNVSVLIPADSDVYVGTDQLFAEQKPPSGGPAVRLVRDTSPGDDKLSVVVIDAETGTTVTDEVLDEDRDAIDRILETLYVGELDSSTAAWPYSGSISPDAPRETSGGMSFLRPDPSTGLQVYGGVGDPFGAFIGLTNGRSTVVINVDPATGQLEVEYPRISDNDRPAFERWVGTINVCENEVKC